MTNVRRDTRGQHRSLTRVLPKQCDLSYFLATPYSCNGALISRLANKWIGKDISFKLHSRFTF